MTLINRTHRSLFLEVKGKRLEKLLSPNWEQRGRGCIPSIRAPCRAAWTRRAAGSSRRSSQPHPSAPRVGLRPSSTCKAQCCPAPRAPGLQQPPRHPREAGPGRAPAPRLPPQRARGILTERSAQRGLSRPSDSQAVRSGSPRPARDRDGPSAASSAGDARFEEWARCRSAGCALPAR